MMRAAVTAPPTPIGELVTGVPPELSTIIDKALAHDPGQRYQDARSLAEDLKRFLTGQLVASHHYSTRERVVRFVRKHRGARGVDRRRAARAPRVRHGHVREDRQRARPRGCERAVRARGEARRRRGACARAEEGRRPDAEPGADRRRHQPDARGRDGQAARGPALARGPRDRRRRARGGRRVEPARIADDAVPRAEPRRHPGAVRR